MGLFKVTLGSNTFHIWHGFMKYEESLKSQLIKKSRRLYFYLSQSEVWSRHIAC